METATEVRVTIEIVNSGLKRKRDDSSYYRIARKEIKIEEVTVRSSIFWDEYLNHLDTLNFQSQPHQ